MFNKQRNALGQYKRDITNTIPFKYPQAIIIASLVVVIGVQNFGDRITKYLPEVKANEVTYVKAEEIVAPVGENERLKKALEERAYELFEENKHIYLEEARLEAVAEYKIRLVGAVYDSPFVEMDDANQQIINLMD